MRFEERNAALATAGLGITLAGALLPWARIGGRRRSGFNTADTFISLAEGALPSQLAWVGRWWYLPPLLALLAWATTFVAAGRLLRYAAVAVLVLGLAMWWLFVWAGANYGVLDTELIGPIVASVGMVITGTCCARPRASLLKPHDT